MHAEPFLSFLRRGLGAMEDLSSPTAPETALSTLPPGSANLHSRNVTGQRLWLKYGEKRTGSVVPGIKEVF